LLGLGSTQDGTLRFTKAMMAASTENDHVDQPSPIERAYMCDGDVSLLDSSTIGESVVGDRVLHLVIDDLRQQAMSPPSTYHVLRSRLIKYMVRHGDDSRGASHGG
jgi:hypothetical protein